MERRSIAFIALFAIIATFWAARSTADEWQVEITSTLWLTGIDATVTAGSHTAEVSVGFDDLIDKVDAAFAFILTAQKDQLIIWAQYDFYSLNEEGVSPLGPAVVDIDTTFFAAGVGWQFLGGVTEDATTEVLIGVRQLSIENEIVISGVGSGRSKADITDTILGVRLGIPFGESGKWHFNPIISIGAGDSEEVWELQPQVEYRFSKTWATRFGYRILNYEIKGEKADFDGSFHGLIFGFSGKF